VAVFLGFALDPDVTVKMIGVGMAAAVLVDATLVRMVLVPAVMELSAAPTGGGRGARPPAELRRARLGRRRCVAGPGRCRA
jgi:hypothetical protein